MPTIEDRVYDLTAIVHWLRDYDTPEADIPKVGRLAMRHFDSFCCEGDHAEAAWAALEGAPAGFSHHRPTPALTTEERFGL